MNIELLQKVAETKEGKELLEYYSQVKRNQPKTSARYVKEVLQERNVPADRKRVIEMLKQLEEAGVGKFHPGNFKKAGLEWSIKPSRLIDIVRGNGKEHDKGLAHPQSLLDEGFEVTLNLRIKNQKDVARLIEVLFGILE